MISDSGIVYKAWVVTMRSLMPSLRFLTLILMYLRNSFLCHIPMIIFISVYTLVSNIFMKNTYRRDWVPTSLCEIPRRSYPKLSVLDLINFIVI